MFADDEKVDPNAYMQLMYEQNSEQDDVKRLQDERIAVINAEVSAVQNVGAKEKRMPKVETLNRAKK